jgi:hypothetical protein
MRVSKLIELASGVDALYLSGRASLPSELLERLETARASASESNIGPPFQFGDFEMTLAPHAWGKYRYCLEHPYGRIGLTPSSRLPSIRIQPRAEFLHGKGPQGVVDWYRELIETTCGFVTFSVTRLDLFADFQGWDLNGDQRDEFLCRAKARHVYEDDGVFNGLVFGTRLSNSVMARIYDKSIESAKTGSGYWKMIWGDAYDIALSVIRVEFELGRNALREYGLRTPEETLGAAGALWASLTGEWLTHRVKGTDLTKSRWGLSPEWECVQRALIAEGAEGINRMYLGRRRGSIENLMPGLVGYLSSFGAYSNSDSLFELLPQLSDFIDQYEMKSGVSFTERISDKRRRIGLP